MLPIQYRAVFFEQNSVVSYAALVSIKILLNISITGVNFVVRKRRKGRPAPPANYSRLNGLCFPYDIPIEIRYLTFRNNVDDPCPQVKLTVTQCQKIIGFIVNAFRCIDVVWFFPFT